jgi:hypothetical protein
MGDGDDGDVACDGPVVVARLVAPQYLAGAVSDSEQHDVVAETMQAAAQSVTYGLGAPCRPREVPPPTEGRSA